MRFLILNTDYPEFLSSLYAQHPGLEQQPYERQMRVRTESLFGVADFYSSNLRKLGHEAWDIHANNEFMQKAWAREHGIPVEAPTPMLQRWLAVLRHARRAAARTPLRYLKPLLRPVLRAFDGQQAWFYGTLTAQIEHYRPDVLLNESMVGIGSVLLKEMKSYVRLLVGQHAATTLPDSEDWSVYDLVISSFPPTIDWFRRKGVRAALHRLGFEPRVLSYLQNGGKKIDVSFVGSFYSVHASRMALLESLCSRCPMMIWGPDPHRVGHDSLIRKCYAGQAWGRDMYQILYDSKITVNHHGDIAPYANNMRLYEATGVGTLLVTDHKDNLGDLFALNREVISYRTPEECGDAIGYYLEHDEERRAIAQAGQKRTLSEHTYYQRMQELVQIVSKYL